MYPAAEGPSIFSQLCDWADKVEDGYGENENMGTWMRDLQTARPVEGKTGKKEERVEKDDTHQAERTGLMLMLAC